MRLSIKSFLTGVSQVSLLEEIYPADPTELFFFEALESKHSTFTSDAACAPLCPYDLCLPTICILLSPERIFCVAIAEEKA